MLSLLLSRSLYGSKARQVAGGFGALLQQAATAAAGVCLVGLRLPRDNGHGGGGDGRSELTEVVGRRGLCRRSHDDDGLAGVAFRRERERQDGRCRRVPEQQEEDPQGPRPYSQQVP